MPPLTWRNVDNPNFSDSNDMFKTAATLLNSGFDAAGRGIKDFRTTTTEEQSAALMQQIIAAGEDPAAIQAAIAGGNSAFLSPEALKFGNAQPDVMLQREGLRLDNKGQILENQGQGLTNTNIGLRNQGQITANSAAEYEFGRAQTTDQRDDNNLAAQPGAIAAITQLNLDLASTDPQVVAAARARQAEVMGAASAPLGINTVAQVQAAELNNQNIRGGALESATADVNFAGQMAGAIKAGDAKALADSILAANGNDPAKSLAMIQGLTDVDPDMQAAAIERITTFGTIKAPAPGTSALDAELARKLGDPVAAPVVAPTSVKDVPMQPRVYSETEKAVFAARNLPVPGSPVDTLLQSGLATPGAAVPAPGSTANPETLAGVNSLLAPAAAASAPVSQVDSLLASSTAPAPVAAAAAAAPEVAPAPPVPTLTPAQQEANNQPRIIYNNTGATRNKPLEPALETALDNVMGKYGVQARVNSGGQDGKGEGTRRTGSTRHDHGGAGDVNFVYQGRNLNWENEADIPMLQNIVNDLKGEGLTGFGAGPGYMNPETTHVGFGTEAIWGEEGGSPYEALSQAFTASRTPIEANGQSTPVASPAAQAQYEGAMNALDTGKDYVAPVDLARPRLPNEDGSVSTEVTATVQVGDKWFNFPTIVNGQRLSQDEAFTAMQEGRNPPTGVFSSVEDAEASAVSRSKEAGDAIAAEEAGGPVAPVPLSTAVNSLLSQASTQPTASVGNAPSRVNTAAPGILNQMLSQQPAGSPVSAAPPIAAPDASAVNSVLNQALAPKAPVNNVTSRKFTIKEVDPNASAFTQGKQARIRDENITSGAMDIAASIRDGSYGGAKGGEVDGFLAGFGDFFTGTPEQNDARLADRTQANAAADWYDTPDAKALFTADPSQLDIAQADPVNFALNQQAAAKAAADGTAAPGATGTTGETAPPTAVQVAAQKVRDETDMNKMFSFAENVGVMDDTNDQYASISAAVEASVGSSESVSDVANRLGGEGGSLAFAGVPTVLNAVQQIATALEVKPEIAAALLQKTSNFNEGFFGMGRGYDVKINEAKALWEKYQKGDGLGSTADGVNRLTARETNAATREAVTALKTEYQGIEAQIKTALQDPNITDVKRKMYEDYLERFKAQYRDKVAGTLEAGSTTANSY